MKVLVYLLLLIGSVACSDNGGDSEAASDQAAAQSTPSKSGNAKPAAEKTKIKPDASAITEMLIQEFGPKAVQAIRVDVEDDGNDAKVTLRGEVPSEEIKQAVMREVAERVERLRLQDFDLVVSGIVPLRRIVEMEMIDTRGVVFTRDLRFCANFESLRWGGSGESIGIWDLTDGKRINRLRINLELPFESMVFSPDGKLLATGHLHDAIMLWTMPLCHESSVLHDAKDIRSSNKVTALAFAPDSKSLVSVHDEKGEVWWWDLGPSRKARLLGTLRAQDRYFLAFSPDGKTLAAAAAGDREITLWNVATGAKWAPLKGPSVNIEAMAWLPDGKTLAVSRYVDKPGVILFDVGSGKARQLTIEENGLIHSIAISSDGKTLASKHDGVGIVLWDLPGAREWTRLDKSKIGTGRGMAFSPDGSTLAVACEQMEPYGLGPAGIQLWDVSARPGAAKTGAQLAAASEPITARDDYLEQQISYKVKMHHGPERTADIHVQVLPDGSVRLHGTVNHESVKEAVERDVAIDFAIETKKDRIPRKVVNELVVKPLRGPE